jgi:hypothetical protein
MVYIGDVEELGDALGEWFAHPERCDRGRKAVFQVPEEFK